MDHGRVAGRGVATVPRLAAITIGAIVVGVLALRPATPTGPAPDAAAGRSPRASIGPSSPPPTPAAGPAGPSSRVARLACMAPPARREVADTTAGRAGQTVVILGDSYSSGWRGVGEGAAGWPAILGAARGWEVHNLAVPGTGFVNPGFTQPIGSRVAAALALSPGLVFVVGGHNDEELPLLRVTRAADHLLDELAHGLPNAVLVVVGPIWPEGDRYGPALVPLRDHLRAKAAAIGAVFIDPIRERWLLGSSARLVGADGTHPTAEGYRRMAEWIGADLQADPRVAADGVGRATPVETDRPSLGAGRMGIGPTCAS